MVGSIFSEGQPPPVLPECVVVDFGDSYTVLNLLVNEDNGRIGWVPLYPENYEWYTSSSTSNSTSETGT